MYDYISLVGNSDFSSFIKIDELREIFIDIDGCRIRSNASAIVQLGIYNIVLQGVNCDKHGNYAFNDDSVFEEINLIEIKIPQGAESEFEKDIRKIANDISRKIGWQIDWREL